MSSWFSSKTSNEVLALSFQGKEFEAVEVRRVGSTTQLGATVRHTLSADLLTGDLVVLGRELRGALEAGGIGIRSCAVSLPVCWALTASTTLPDLSDADAESLLELETERGFSLPPETLSIVTSRFKTRDGNQMATQVALQRERLGRLEGLLRVARLDPVTMTFGALPLAEIFNAGMEAGATWVVSGSQSELVVHAPGGLGALRTWELPLENPVRELRVTLGHLPAAVSDSIKTLRVVGQGAAFERLVADIEARMNSLGLKLETAQRFPGGLAGVPADLPASTGIAVAAGYLTGQKQKFEYLPPKVSAWKQYSDRYGSRKLVMLGQITAAIAAIVAAAFLWQQYNLSRLRSRWSQISSRVRAAEDLQAQIRQFRPWYDTSVRSLAILRRVTESFPEDSAVTAKIVEIRENGTVNCTGTARDNTALLGMLDRLRANSDISKVQLDQVRGKAPMQFSFNFLWAPGVRN